MALSAKSKGKCTKSEGTVCIIPDADDAGLEILLIESESSSYRLTGRAIWCKSFNREPSNPPIIYL
jgi:hypothetical protein